MSTKLRHVAGILGLVVAGATPAPEPIEQPKGPDPTPQSPPVRLNRRARRAMAARARKA
jgi:hypothetical protein